MSCPAPRIARSRRPSSAGALPSVCEDGLLLVIIPSHPTSSATRPKQRCCHPEPSEGPRRSSTANPTPNSPTNPPLIRIAAPSLQTPPTPIRITFQQIVIDKYSRPCYTTPRTTYSSSNKPPPQHPYFQQLPHS